MIVLKIYCELWTYSKNCAITGYLIRNDTTNQFLRSFNAHLIDSICADTDFASYMIFFLINGSRTHIPCPESYMTPRGSPIDVRVILGNLGLTMILGAAGRLIFVLTANLNYLN